MNAPTRTSWGPWTLDRDVLVLELVIDGRYLYEVDLERCPTAGAVLDWIAQVEGKGFATPEVVGHLVTALCDLLVPQARLCSQQMNRHDSESTATVRDRILAAEIETRAYRLTAERHERACKARAAAGEAPVLFASAAELFREHDEAVDEVRRELLADPEATR